MINNYLFVWEKSLVNSQNVQVFYWKCASYFKTKCTARVTTKQVNESHEIIKISDQNQHNHLSSSSSIEVRKLTSTLKERSKTSSEFPSVLVQNALSSVTEEVHPYIPSESDLKQRVNHLVELLFQDIYHDNFSDHTYKRNTEKIPERA